MTIYGKQTKLWCCRKTRDCPYYKESRIDKRLFFPAKEKDRTTELLIRNEVYWKMKNNNPSEQSTYWRHPWGKWAVLLVAAVNLMCLWRNISGYQEFSSVMEQIYSATEFEKWKLEKLFQCSTYGVATAIFLGEFLIGTLSHRKRTAEMAGGLLLLIVGISWLIIGFILGFASLGSGRIFWLVFSSCVIPIGIYFMWKSWRNEKT